MQPLSPESWALLKLLGDGDWHDYEAVLAALCEQIAPGRALRQWAMNRTTRPLRVRPEPSEDRKIASGARSLASATFHSMSKRYLDFKTDEKGRRTHVRRRPGVTPVMKSQPHAPAGESKTGETSAAVADLPAALVRGAERPRSDGNGALRVEPAMSPAQLPAQLEELLRRVVREEISVVLATTAHTSFAAAVEAGLKPAFDSFQKGMQHFLSQRFAALEQRLPDRLPPRAHGRR